MAGLDADTSSYPKPTAGKSLVDQVKDFGAIQQQRQQISSGALTIEKQKLDLMNQQYGYLLRELNSLPANVSGDDLMRVGQQAVKMKLINPEMYSTFVSNIPKDPAQVPAYRQEIATKLATTQEAINYHYGQNQDINQGNQTAIGVRASPMMGGGFKQTGTLFEQPSPNTPVNINGQQSVVGASGPAGVQPPPSAATPQQQPTQAVSGPTGPTVERTDLEQPSQPQQGNPRFPNAIPTAAPPLFDEGKAAYTKDQQLATQKLTALKPALLAVQLIPGLRSGPGTSTWNQAVAALKANNIIPTDAKNDPTAVYQEVNKYLHQYLKGRGGRSDADLMAAEESSPNPGKQINPALLKLTQTAIAQDRIEAARALNFGNRNDYQNYGRYASSFPALMDERAFSVDTLTSDQKKDLAKELKKMTPNQLERFKNSLRIFDASKVGG